MCRVKLHTHKKKKSVIRRWMNVYIIPLHHDLYFLCAWRFTRPSHSFARTTTITVVQSPPCDDLASHVSGWPAKLAKVAKRCSYGAYPYEHLFVTFSNFLSGQIRPLKTPIFNEGFRRPCYTWSNNGQKLVIKGWLWWSTVDQCTNMCYMVVKHGRYSTKSWS